MVNFLQVILAAAATTYVLLHVFSSMLECRLSYLEAHLGGRIVDEPSVCAERILCSWWRMRLVWVSIARMLTLLRYRWRRRSQLGNSRYMLRNGMVKRWRHGRRRVAIIISLHICCGRETSRVSRSNDIVVRECQRGRQVAGVQSCIDMWLAHTRGIVNFWLEPYLVP
jgi:hypothetical protein